MRYSPKKISLLILVYVALICLIASGLASCSTAKVLKSNTISKHDSSAVSNTAAASVKKNDSLVVNKIDSSFYNNLLLVFENDTAAAVDSDLKDIAEAITPIQENDYEAADKSAIKVPAKSKAVKTAAKPPRKPFVYNINGNTVESPVPLKSAVIQNNGHVEQVNINQVKSVDSNNSTAVTAVTVHEEKNIVSKEKRSSGLPWYVWFLLIAILLAAALYVLRRYKII